jgi:hypothetical protein
MSRFFLASLIAGLGLIVLVGCGGQSAPPTSPAARATVVIGVDALDWQVLDPVLESGRAPHFAELCARGASGINLSFVPLEKSPLIWASMATGLEPEGHGVGGFVKQRGDDRYETLASAADWQAPAIWDIAGAAGLRSAVIGWWVTFPARDIDGVMVSDHVTFTTAGHRNPEGMVRPAALTDELIALGVDWREVPLDLLRVVLPDAPDDVLADLEHPQLEGLRLAIAGDLTYLATARHLLARDAYDFFAVYFRGFDLVCHDYWQYWRHGDAREPSAEDRALLGTIVPNYLLLVDAWLGELRPLLPEGANIVVVSDHGFHGPRRDRSGSLRKGVAEHRPEGALIIESALYTPGHRFDRSFVLNVTPTLLALLGLPASQEMPGRVLRDGLAPAAIPYVDHLETHRIASYAPLAPAPPPGVADDPALDAAVKKKLKSLGYVD